MVVDDVTAEVTTTTATTTPGSTTTPIATTSTSGEDNFFGLTSFSPFQLNPSNLATT